MAIPNITITFDVVANDDGPVPEIFASREGDHMASAILPHDPPEDSPEVQSWADVSQEASDREEYLTELLDNASYHMERLVIAAITLAESGGELQDAVDAVNELRRGGNG